MQLFNTITSLFDRFVKVLSSLAILLLIPMMFLVPADVVGRCLKTPIPVVFEINSYFLMVAIVFFPLAFVQQNREHIYVNLFTRSCPERIKGAMDIFSLLTGIIAYGLIGWYGLETAIHSTGIQEYVSGGIDLPIWISKWFVPLGSFVFCLQLLRDTAHHIKRILFHRE